MSTTQRYCLRWNNHQSNLLTVFDQLLHDGSFVDVTLAVEGQYLKAHKMVLSACSPYFQTLFINHPDKHPIVILKDVPYCDMRCLLDFMYRGEVSVDQDRLTAFLRIAETLRIKGLTEVNENESLYNHQQPQQNNLNPPNLHRIQQYNNNNNNNNNNSQVANNKLQNSQKVTDQPQQTSNNNSYLSTSSSSLHQKRKRGRPRKLSGGSGDGTPSQSASSPVDDLENRLSGGDQEESIDYDGSLVKSEVNNSQPMDEDDNDNDEEMMIQNIKQEPIASTSKDTADGSFSSVNDQQFTSNNNNNQSELIYCLELSGNINSPINISQQTCSEICESVIISADEFTRQQQLRQDSVIKTLSLDVLQSEATILQSESTLSYSNKRDSEIENEASTSKRFRTRKEQPTIIDVYTETSDDEMLSISSDSSFHLSDTDFENEDTNDDDGFNVGIMKKNNNKCETQEDNDRSTTDIVVENFINQNSMYGIRDKKDLLKYKTLEDGSVVCKLCSKKFDSRTQWYRHKYKTHNESETIITVQPVSLDNLDGISSQDSERALSISALFKCDKCQVFYKSRRGYLGHINRRHKNNENATQLLSSNNSSDNEFDKNYSEANKQLINKCRQKSCNISFQKPDESERRKDEEKIINDIIERVRKECEEQGLPTK